MRSLLFAALLTAPALVAAQPTWRAVPPGGLSVDFLKAVPGQSAMVADVNGNAVGEANSTMFHSAAIFSTRLPVTRRVSFIAELPFSFTNYDGASVAADPVGAEVHAKQYGFGNPYVGVAARTRSGFSAEVGGRLPVFTVYGEGAETRGTFSETTWGAANAEQSEAFMPFTYTLGGRVGIDREVTESLGFRADVAPSYLASTQTYATADGDVEPTAIIARYGLQVTAEAGRFELAGGVVGRESLIDDYDYVPESTTAGIVSAVYAGNQFRPGLTVRVPVRGAEAGDAILGLSLDVPLR